MKLMYFDTETTGTKHWRNGIHQISGAIEIDGEVLEYFDFKIQPNPAATIEAEALAIGNVTEEQIKAYMPFNTGYKLFVAMISKYVNKYDKKDKFFLVGFNNAAFDNFFLRAFFVQNGDDYFGSWFWMPPIDVMVLAGNFLMQRRVEMDNFKQSTVAAFLGVKVDHARLHDAEYDVQLLIQIYKQVR